MQKYDIIVLNWTFCFVQQFEVLFYFWFAVTHHLNFWFVLNMHSEYEFFYPKCFAFLTFLNFDWLFLEHTCGLKMLACTTFINSMSRLGFTLFECVAYLRKYVLQNPNIMWQRCLLRMCRHYSLVTTSFVRFYRDLPGNDLYLEHMHSLHMQALCDNVALFWMCHHYSSVVTTSLWTTNETMVSNCFPFAFSKKENSRKQILLILCGNE